MVAGKQCYRCKKPIPQLASIWWKCTCGYQNGLLAPDGRGFFDRNAGKLLIWAFAGPIPLRVLSVALGITPLTWLADILFAVLIICAIGGYIARKTSKNEERT